MHFSFRKVYLYRPPTRRIPQCPIILRRREGRKVAACYPDFALPLEEADALGDPGREGVVGIGVWGVLGVVAGGFVAEPFGGVVVFGVSEAVEGFVGARFVDDFRFLTEAAKGDGPRRIDGSGDGAGRLEGLRAICHSISSENYRRKGRKPSLFPSCAFNAFAPSQFRSSNQATGLTVTSGGWRKVFRGGNLQRAYESGEPALRGLRWRLL